MRAALAVFALLVVGAVAQDYTHIVAGDFTRGDLVSTGHGLVRWDSVAKKYVSTTAPASLGLGTILDIEVAGPDVLYLLASGGRVVEYVISKEAWQVIAEVDAGINDILVADNRVYVCGAFTFTRGRVEGQTTVPDVISVGYVNAASDQPRNLWLQIPPADVALTAPSCKRLFSFSGRLLMINTADQLVFKSNVNDWYPDASSTNIAAGQASNLRTTAGSGVGIRVDNYFQDGARLYIQSNSGFTLQGDLVNVYRIVYTTDGVTFAGALRFDETALNLNPFRYTADLSSFAAKGEEIFFFASRSNGTRTYWAMHKAPVSTQAVGVNTAQTRLTTTFIGNGENNQAGSPVSGAGMWWVGEKLVFHCAYTVCVNYTEVSYTDSENDDRNLVLYRYATRMGSFIGFEGTSYTTENGGGLTSDTNDASAPVKVVKSDTSYWYVGSFTRAWNKRWLGLVGYNAKNKEWTGLGDPLQDWLSSPTAIDSTTPPNSNNPTRNSIGRATTINTIHHFGVDNGAVAVIAAGPFRRIYNNTFNGIAWMRTDKVGEWNQLGNIGLHSAASVHTYTISKNGNPVGTNFYLQPGTVNAIASTTHKAKGKNGRTLWIGGEFLGTGATVSALVLNNVARYSFGDENDKTFTSMMGGVNGPVYAIDAKGPLVYVGGAFTRAGNMTVSNIAMWDDDKQMWSNMQTGVAGNVRQIWADSPSNVWVVTEGSNNAGGATNPRNQNIFRWDGSRWTTWACETCGDACESRQSINGACGGAATVELRHLGSDLYRRASNGALTRRDGNRWRNIDTSTLGAVDNTYKALLAKAVTGGRRFVVGSNTAAGNGLADKLTPYIAEVDFDNDNVYPVVGAGFDAPVRQISGASAVAPALALLAVALIAMLF